MSCKWEFAAPLQRERAVSDSSISLDKLEQCKLARLLQSNSTSSHAHQSLGNHPYQRAASDDWDGLQFTSMYGSVALDTIRGCSFQCHTATFENLSVSQC